MWLLGLLASLTKADDPSFLVTFHGGTGKKEVNNVYRYSLSGSFLGAVVRNENEVDTHGLRGLAYLPDTNELLVANAYVEDSKILRLSNPCAADAHVWANESLDHPYGLSVHNGVVVASSQNSGKLTLFSLATGRELLTPVFPIAGDPRGVAWGADGSLFVASKDANALIQYSAEGKQIQSKKVKNPIGVTVNGNTVYVGSDVTPAMVYGYDVTSFSKVKTFTDETNLQHPAGMEVFGDTLYVLSQDTFSLLKFNITTQAYLGRVIQNFADVPEDLLLLRSGCFPVTATPTLTPTPPTTLSPTFSPTPPTTLAPTLSPTPPTTAYPTTTSPTQGGPSPSKLSPTVTAVVVCAVILVCGGLFVCYRRHKQHRARTGVLDGLISEEYHPVSSIPGSRTGIPSNSSSRASGRSIQ